MRTNIAKLLLVAAVLGLASCAASEDSEESSFRGKADNPDRAGVYRAKLSFSIGWQRGYLVVEVLDDDLIHFAYGAGDGPSVKTPIYSSEMVGKRDYEGPLKASFKAQGGHLETAELSVDVRDNCFDVYDLKKQTQLSTLCGDDLGNPFKRLSIDRMNMQNAYGLGQHFFAAGASDGDWVSTLQKANTVKSTSGEFGNAFAGYYGGAVPQLQFPVIYAVGPDSTSYALLLDNVYKQQWDVRGDWWWAGMYGDEIRGFVMTGPDLVDLRKDFMELTGKPPVPPRKAFGLWVSEFGFDNWGEIDWKLKGLRDASFPVDGFVMDLQWFGSTQDGSWWSRMGSLDWDRNRFANPEQKIADYKKDHVGLITIEESYVAGGQWAYGKMKDKQGLVHECDGGATTMFSNWMGQVGMIDWANRSAAAYWHDTLRENNLVKKGILGHWTDLGEPERYSSTACYYNDNTGPLEPGKYHHGDIHNLYNLLWHSSIYDGYYRHRLDYGADSQPRPFLLARAGTVGIQRYGAAMWSGDIPSRLDALATHMNSQMHMQFAGIDYYGSDAGGFWRKRMWEDTLGRGGNASRADLEWSLYTQWLANSSWFDVPLRPHTYNCGFGTGGDMDWGCPWEVSPASIGDQKSNLANIRQRYELIPYYYSLAHRAYRFGEPVFPPPVMLFQSDTNVRQMGHQKMIGQSLMVGIVANAWEDKRRIYLPKGTWVNYHTNAFVQSQGQWTGDQPLWRDGVLRLPVFARAGAILPLMLVDDQTKDAYGHRKDGSVRDELIVKVFADTTASSFVLYEDDGASITAWDDARKVPTYATRQTQLTQKLAGSTATVTVDGAQGSYKSAPILRQNEVRLVVNGKTASSVTMNHQPLPLHKDAASFQAADKGYFNAGGNVILMRSGKMDVNTQKTFKVELQ
jgi:alpha-glucosidase (family GH31 glycosyl hydrolase)